MAGLNQMLATRRGRGLFALAISASILGASRLLANGDFGVPLCLFRAATRLPCPSCGMTRAFCGIAHGDLPAAIDLNLASPLVFLATVTIALLGVLQALTEREFLSSIWNRTKRVVVPLTVVALGAAWTANLAGVLGR